MEDLKKTVEEALEMPEEELMDALPSLMDELEGNVEEVMEAIPDLISRLTSKMGEIDVGKFVSDAPEASAKFMDILWEGMGIIAEKNPDVKSKLKSAGEVTINFEATDSPLKGHQKISGGKLSGGSTPLDEADLTLSGSTEVMVGLLTGDVDPVQGFMSGKFKMDGNMALGMKLAPVMTSLASAVKGG